MAGRQDSTTRLNVDVTDFKKNIQEANRQIRLANAEFREASSRLDDWAKSTDGVTAKLKQLHTTEEAQKKVLETLEEKYAKVVEKEGKASAGAMELEARILNQKAAINNTQREIAKYNDSMAEMERESEENSSATGKLKSEIEKQTKELEQAKKRYSQLALEQKEGSKEAKYLEKEIENLSAELKENRDKLEDAEKAADKFDNSLEQTKESSQEASGGFTLVKGVLSNLVSQGINKAVEAFKDLITTQSKASKSFQAETGASAESMKAYNEQMQELYKQNYGGDLEDIAKAMAEVKQQTKETDPTKLKDLTKNALALRDTFDMDVKESMRAVNTLMNQFEMSGEEAFNLIVQGAQDGLNANGDLLDVINEYGVQFKNGGYSANDMFNMLKNGADEGTWSVDKLGDAVKEYTIRMSDGTATEHLKKLGINADEAMQKFAKGGEDAQEVTNQIMEALQNVENEQERYTIGQGIMGTMWEDLGENAVIALMNTKGEIDKNISSMEELHNVKYDDVGSKFTELGRSIKDEFIMPIVEKAIPKVKELVEYAIKNIPKAKEEMKKVKDTLEKWLPLIVGIGSAIVTYFAVTKILAFINAIRNGTIALQLFNLVMSMNPIGLIIAAIVGLVAAFVVLWNKSEAFRNFWIGLWEIIKGAVASFIDFFKNLPENVRTWFDNTVEKAKEFGDKMKEKAIETGKNFLENIISFFKNLPYKVGHFTGQTLTKVILWVLQMRQKAIETGSNFISGVIDFIKNLPSKIWEWFLKAVAKAENFKKDIKEKAKAAGKEFVNDIKEKLTDLPDKIKEKFDKGIEKAKTFVTDLGKKGKEAAEELIKKVKDGAADIPEKVKEIGKNIVDGVWKGITDARDKFFKNIKDFFSGMVDGAKEELDINSPSRVMRDQVGKMIALGVAEGIKQNRDKVKSAMKQLAQEAEKAGNINVSMGVDIAKRNVASATSGGVGSTTMNTTNNNAVTYNTFNQYNSSPKALSRLEIYRQTQRQLKLAKG